MLKRGWQQMIGRAKSIRSLRMVSTFNDIETAEWALKEVVRVHDLRIKLHSLASGYLRKHVVSFKLTLDRVIGWGVTDEDPDVSVEMRSVEVVIEFREFNHMPYYVLTAFPIL